jgi:hypothetical protein
MEGCDQCAKYLQSLRSVFAECAWKDNFWIGSKLAPNGNAFLERGIRTPPEKE